MKFPNIDAERARRGLTKARLAAMLEIDPSTLKNWQSGKHPIPSDKLLLMKELFGCSVDYLISSDDTTDAFCSSVGTDSETKAETEREEA